MQIGLLLFFSSENQNSTKTIISFTKIPALSLLHVYLFLYFLSQSILLHVYMLPCSLSLHEICFVSGLHSSSCLPGNNSPFLFCWIYVIDLGFLHGGLHIVRNLNARTYFDWKICCCRCFCFWVVDLFGFLAAFETCPFLGFDYNYYFICRHIDIIGIRPVFFFFFWWVGNKLINEFSLLCFSFKNQDCVYGLLIKI